VPVRRQLTTVTIGTDGPTNYVQIPDGSRYNLGTLSVLKFVAALVSGRGLARQALDRFNAEGQAMIPIDLDAMEALFVPRRARWAASPLISAHDHHPMPGKDASSPMADDTLNPNTLPQHLDQIEHQVAAITHLAAAGKVPAEALKGLRAMVAAISLPNFGDQSSNSAFNSMGAPRVDTVNPEAPQKLPTDLTHPKVASHETLVENSKLAGEILQTVMVTEDRIDRLVAAGRKFNAAKAKGDLLTVTSKISSLLQEVDLAHTWVKNDLHALSKQASRIHDLFATAKI